MKHDSTQQSLARKVAANTIYIISWCIIFPIIVFAGVINIVTNKVKAHKQDANTPVISDQSKIVPKNTQDSFKLDKEER